MNGKAHIVVLSVVVCLLFAQGAHAGSLIEQQLANIRDLHVEVLVPRYQPLPGPPPERLEASLRERVTKIVEKHDLRSIDASQQELVLEIQLAMSVTNDKPIALLVLLELREPAVLTREWEPESAEELTVTSWREVLLVVTSSEDLLERLFELVDLGATRFAEEVQQARSRR